MNTGEQNERQGGFQNGKDNEKEGRKKSGPNEEQHIRERHITPKAGKERHQLMGVFTYFVEGKREKENIYKRVTVGVKPGNPQELSSVVIL